MKYLVFKIALKLYQMQQIHQKHLDNSVPFDCHLHCRSALHTTAHRKNKTVTDMHSNHRPQPATLVKVLMFTCLFSVIPCWSFYVLLSHKSWQAFKKAFVIHNSTLCFTKICFIILINLVLRSAKVLLCFLVGL